MLKFQSEIQEISNRAQAKQREEDAAAAAALAKDVKAGKSHPAKSSSSLPPLPSAPAPITSPAAPSSTLTTAGDAGPPIPDLQSLVLAAIASPEDDDDAFQLLVAHLEDRLATSGARELLVHFGRHRSLTTWYVGEKKGDENEAAEGEGEPLVDDVDLRSIEEVLRKAMKHLDGEILPLLSSPAPSPTYSALLRLPAPSLEHLYELRIAVVGNVDAGKSTTLGVLTRGGLDDGRGKARVALFRHKHEIESGRTSSVGLEILGFEASGKPVLPEPIATSSHGADDKEGRKEKLSWEDICKRSAKVVSFIDLAGHERYLKTTIFGMTGCAPDYCLLMVGGNAGLIGMSKEHLAVALALNVPVIVIISKIDMTPPNVLDQTKAQLSKILKSPGCRRTPVYVEDMRDVVELSQTFVKDRLCPIFMLSNVTGESLPFLRSFLNLLPSSAQNGGPGGAIKHEVDAPLEYSISDVFSVPFVGTVVNGVINSGAVKTGDTVLLGPDSLGQFVSTSVKSIQRKRASVNSAEAGQSVSFALKRVRRAAVRKGMVIVAKSDTGDVPKAVRRFEGQVLILYHNTTIQPGYQAVMHTGAVRQTCKIISMDHPKGLMRTGDRCTVVFEFVSVPEFVKIGDKLLFREGRSKGLGVVTKLLT